ncbi:TPA: hypothetical protein NI746_005467 [Pseudomonas aeruginosa]|nr:hypothetical protein [Pseudomonas aeruginosa]
MACIEQAVEPLRVVGADDAPCLSQQIVVERQGKVRDPLVGRRVTVEGVFQAASAVDPATAIERGRAATSPTPGDAFSTRVTIVPDSSRMPRTL